MQFCSNDYLGSQHIDSCNIFTEGKFRARFQLLAHACVVLYLRHSSWGSHYPFVQKGKVHCSPILVMAT